MKVYKENFKNGDLLGYDIFRDSILTEKSVKSETEDSCMTFYVNPNITKNHIRFGVSALFNVRVLSVRICNTKGRMKNFRGKKFETNGKKKAFVKVDDLNRIREVLSVETK